MAKKISFSVRNDDLDEMEKISKSTGKKVIEIIRERYELGKKSEDLSKKIHQLSKKISKIEKENDEKYIKIFSLFEVVIRQNVFSNEVLNSVLKGNRKEDDLKNFEKIIETKSDEKISQIRRIYHEEIDANGS